MKGKYLECFTVKIGEPNLDGHYVLRMVKCPRRDCPNSPHGPYLYRRYYVRPRRRGKFMVKEEYIGKEGSERERRVQALRLGQQTGRAWDESIPF